MRTDLKSCVCVCAHVYIVLKCDNTLIHFSVGYQLRKCVFGLVHH